MREFSRNCWHIRCSRHLNSFEFECHWGKPNLIGTLDHRYREATVVVAGIAGMLTAYELYKRGFRVTLLEQKARAGGLIRTTRTEQGIAKSAAHSLLVSDPVRELGRELGVQLVEPRKEASAKFIMRDGHLVPSARRSMQSCN